MCETFYDGVERGLSKDVVLNYKGWLVENYAPASVNSMLASINCFLCFVSREDCRVKQLKIQRQLFAYEDRELTKGEYRRLIKAAKEKRIGAVFVTKTGKPLDRSNIWREMKALCKSAAVPGKKVFPHNLRHLFARSFYSIEKDVVRLADLLGHSSINTTRVYTTDTGMGHIRSIEKVIQWGISKNSLSAKCPIFCPNFCL